MKMFELVGTIDKKVGEELIYVNADTVEEAVAKLKVPTVPTGKCWLLSKDWK